MERVVVLGRGGAGESTFARHLAQLTGLPVTELDRHFWSKDLSPLSGRGLGPRAGAARWAVRVASGAALTRAR